MMVFLQMIATALPNPWMIASILLWITAEQEEGNFESGRVFRVQRKLTQAMLSDASQALHRSHHHAHA